MVGVEFKLVVAQAEAGPGWPGISVEQADRAHVAKVRASVLS